MKNLKSWGNFEKRMKSCKLKLWSKCYKLKFTKDKIIEFVVVPTKQAIDKYEIVYEENNEVLLLKPNTFGKSLLQVHIKNLPSYVLYVEEMSL